MLDIVPVDLAAAPVKATIMDLDRFDHVVFVSRNAVRHGMPALEQYWPQWPVRLQWYAVGEATAAALAEFDISPHVPADASSEGLLELSRLEQVDAQKILIVRGVGGRETLAETLAARGGVVTYLEVYERRPVRLSPERRAAVRACLPAVAVLYSGAALDAFIDNLDADVRDRCTLVVPSRRIDARAREAGFRDVRLADSAAEAAMVQAVLQSRS